jgi:hypothetical protein
MPGSERKNRTEFLDEAIVLAHSAAISLLPDHVKLKIYDAPHALNAEATRDRIAFLAKQLSFKPPDANAASVIPALVQPP